MQDAPMAELYGYFNAYNLNYTGLQDFKRPYIRHSDYKTFYLLWRADAWISMHNLAMLGAHNWRWISASLKRLQFSDLCELARFPTVKAGSEIRARITPAGRAYIQEIQTRLAKEREIQEQQLQDLRDRKQALSRKKTIGAYMLDKQGKKIA